MSRTYSAITTCNVEGWACHGKRMVESFVKNWPAEIQLTVYAEDFKPDVEGILVAELPVWQRNFKARHATMPAANGHKEKRYDYRFDAVKFSHKPAAVIDASRASRYDILIWIDADTVTHSPVPFAFIDSLLPIPKELAWLERPGTHPECGFFMLDLQSQNVNRFIEALMMLYRHDRLFSYQESHDSYLIQQLALEHGLRTVSLSGPKPTSHPFINGPLGAFIDHLKGARKRNGRSHSSDLKVPRTEPYWVEKP